MAIEFVDLAIKTRWILHNYLSLPQGNHQIHPFNPFKSQSMFITLWQTYKKLLKMPIEIVDFPMNNGWIFMDFPGRVNPMETQRNPISII